MKRGDSKTVQVTVGNLTASGLTGFSYWFTAKSDFGDADLSAVIRKVGSQAIPGDFTTVVLGAVNTDGIITCQINPSDTNSLPDYDVQLQYDVQVEDSQGRVTTIVDGILTVQVDVTRAS